jgi:hypothetical protein
VLVTLIVACRRPEVWRTYSSSRGGFSVQLPGEPKTRIDASSHRPQDEETDGGVREDAPFVSEETYAERGEDGVYRVRWYEVPIDDELTDHEFLSRLVASKQLGPVVPRWLHLGPFQGIEYERIEPTLHLRLRARIFIVEGRAFHVWANNWIGRDDEEAARRFLDSFQLEVRPGLPVTYDGTIVARQLPSPRP